MPTYGYRCTACGNEFDVWQRMTDEPGAACPACGSPSRRMIFPVGIVFKGAGFYKTDSRSSSSAATPAAPTSNGSGAGSTASPATPDAAPSPPTTTASPPAADTPS